MSSQCKVIMMNEVERRPLCNYLDNEITNNSYHSIQLITEQSLTIHTQTSLIFMLLQESWKPIFY